MQQLNKLSGSIVCIAAIVSLTSCNGGSAGNTTDTGTSNVLTSSCLSAGIDSLSKSGALNIVLRNNCDVKQKLSDVSLKLLSNSSVAKGKKFVANNGDKLDFSKNYSGNIATIEVVNGLGNDSITAAGSIVFSGVNTSSISNLQNTSDSVVVINNSDLAKVPSSGGIYITEIPDSQLTYNSSIKDIPPGQFGLKALQVTNKYNNNVTIKLNTVLPKGISYSYAYATPTDPTRTTCVGAEAVLKPNQSCNVVLKYNPTSQGANANFNYSVQGQNGPLSITSNSITLNYSSRTYLYFTEGNIFTSQNQSDVQACKILAGGVIDTSTCITNLVTNNANEFFDVMANENGLLYAIQDVDGYNFIKSCNIDYSTGGLNNCNYSTDNTFGLGGMTVFGGYAYVTVAYNPYLTPQLWKCSLNNNGSVNMGECIVVQGASMGSGNGVMGHIFIGNSVAYLTTNTGFTTNFLHCAFSNSGISCGVSPGNSNNGYTSVTFFKSYVYFAGLSEGVEKCTFDAKNGVVPGSCKRMPLSPGGGPVTAIYAYVFGNHMYIYNGPISMCDLDDNGDVVSGSCNTVTVKNNNGLSNITMRILHPQD